MLVDRAAASCNTRAAYASRLQIYLNVARKSRTLNVRRLSQIFRRAHSSTKIICSDFNGQMFLLREYTDTRWDKRLSVTTLELESKHTEHRLNVRLVFVLTIRQ